MSKKKKKRGSGTHGHGSSKKNRGAGSRGGRGKAGMGKKAKHKKRTAQEGGKYLGEKGFQRPDSVQNEQNGINLKDIDQRIDQFVEAGVAEKDGDSYVFDADEAGYDKVLGGGKLTKDIDIKAAKFSSSAEDKIADNGNEAIELEDE
ncbi:MAG: uL15m family ribosomal protein [Candidatus Nanohaloarchaea archaeon]|nr:uL15m family ribosomal protein [Candidatus Nanohaloarchaea archaeon]